MAKKSRGKGGGGGEGGELKKEENDGVKQIEIVLKTNLHCDGCCKRIKKSILGFPGVWTVEFDGEWKVKIKAAARVNPSELRNRVEKKTSKQVEILSPLPRKEDKKENSEKDKPKEKEPPVTTVVLKVEWHCDGCGEKIRKAISSCKGVNEMSVDKEKDLVTVKGKVEAIKMVEMLKDKLRKPVEIVPEKKEKKDSGGGDNNQKEEGGGKGNKSGGDKASNVDRYVTGSGYFHEDDFVHLVDPFHGPHFFSEENPHGCSVM